MGSSCDLNLWKKNSNKYEEKRRGDYMGDDDYSRGRGLLDNPLFKMGT